MVFETMVIVTWRIAMAQLPLGDLQLEVMRFLADREPMSVGEVAVQFGKPRGLARTTVLTVMERLREKGYLSRTKEGAAFRYAAHAGKTDLQQGLVRDFVERALEGSVSPF